MNSPLGGMTPAHFLKHYWQKKPLVIRNAFPHFKDPVTRDELAGLSLEEEVDSRLVIERGGRKAWEVIHGPQQASRLKKLPPSHWTLLVQGVDRYVSGVASLLDFFRFIPNWRVEDVMISFAPNAGSVGPHVDSYDVFLLQGQGRRRWRIDQNASRDLRSGLDLRILKQFNATNDWTLEPGDMLYLPPDLAHYGVALGECLTYSIGFRAPSGMDLLAAAQERFQQTGRADPRFSDSDLKPTDSPGEITRSSLKKFRKVMNQALVSLTEREFDAMVGEILTESKGTPGPYNRTVSASELKAHFRKGGNLIRSPGSRLAYVSGSDGSTDLFADGRRFTLDRHTRNAAPLLSENRRIPLKTLQPYLKQSAFVLLLGVLVNAGTFQLDNA